MQSTFVRAAKAAATFDGRSSSARNWLFGIVFGFALLHLAAAVLHIHRLSAVTLIVCVGGPALLAALHGFLSQIETVRLRERSESMVHLLRDRQQQLRALDLQGTPDSASAVWGLACEALGAAALMMDETAAWSLIYKNADIHAG